MARTTNIFNELMDKDTLREEMQKAWGMGATMPKQYLNINKYKCLDWYGGWGHSGGCAGASGGSSIERPSAAENLVAI